MKSIITIDDLSVELPFRVREGDPLTPELRAILEALYVRRMGDRLRAWLTKNAKATPNQVENWIAQNAPEFVFDDSPELDAIEAEARVIADEMIRAKLTSEGLPIPKAIDDHITQLASLPQIIERARERVLARLSATRELLGVTS